MGPFILGILFGWLLEWLFFNFWIKGRSSNDSASSTDTSALKSELNSKNNIIVDLKSKLEKAESSSKAVANSSVAAASKPVAKVSSSTKATKSKPVAAKSVTATKTTSAKTATKAKPATKKAVKTTSTTNNKSTSTAKKSTTAPAKKLAQTKTKVTQVKSKTATKSGTATKTTKKTATAKSSVTKNKATKPSGDDLTKLSGIGPSMALKLNDLGINSYNKLAEMDDDILRDMLEASGARLNNNKEAMDSWNEQAELAGKGDFSGLKKLQEELKK